MSSKIDKYLGNFTQRICSILSTKVVGIYLQGSSAQNDFQNNKSDLDIVVVVDQSISDEEKASLATYLDHQNLPVPAAGLDLIIVHQNAIASMAREPEYEFWFSTGVDWDTEVEWFGRTSEVLIFLATCAAQAKTVFGADAQRVFKPVPRYSLLQAITDVLEWHQTKIGDDLHDPLCQYSVLNASRAWMFAEVEKLGSKSEGGEWVLARDPDNNLVKNALLVRQG